MRILIADDSSFMLDRLQQMLCSLENVEVVGSFPNGTDALSALREQKPDLAILDVKMPGLSGFEVLKEIRKENHTIKIIILTFYSAEYQRTRAMKLGADYFFSKVDDFEKIPDVILQLTSNENE